MKLITVIFAIFAFFLGVCVGSTFTRESIKRQATEAGVANYDPDKDVLQFKNTCE